MTGVQTCALPISEVAGNVRVQLMFDGGAILPVEMTAAAGAAPTAGLSSELSAANQSKSRRWPGYFVWRPFSVRTLMREQNNSPFAGKPVKMQCLWREIDRRAGRFGIAFNGPVIHPIDAAETAIHVATVAAMQGWCPAFLRAAYDAWFVGGEDPGHAPVLSSILSSLSKDVDATLALAAAEPARLRPVPDSRWLTI